MTVPLRVLGEDRAATCATGDRAIPHELEAELVEGEEEYDEEEAQRDYEAGETLYYGGHSRCKYGRVKPVMPMGGILGALGLLGGRKKPLALQGLGGGRKVRPHRR